jgi:hypothetical protein
MNLASRFRRYIRIISKDLENDKIEPYNKPKIKEVFATSIGFIADTWEGTYNQYKYYVNKVKEYHIVGDYMIVFLLDGNDVIVLEANDMTGLVDMHDTIVSS